MLYHTDILYAAEGLEALYSDLAVKLHGAAMRLIPTELAAEFHRNSRQPFSLFCMQAEDGKSVLARVSALTEQGELVARALAAQERVNIFGMKKPLLRAEVRRAEPMSAEGLFYAEIPKGYRVDFLTPAIFRRSGKSHCSPDLSRYLLSAAEKLAEFEGCEIDAERLMDYVRSIPLDSYSLCGSRYNVSGSVYNGMTGWAEILFPDRTSENAVLLNAVLRYAEYSGAGAKTAVGMGGVAVTPIL